MRGFGWILITTDLPLSFSCFDFESGLHKGTGDDGNQVHGRTDYRGVREHEAGQRPAIWPVSAASRKPRCTFGRTSTGDVSEARRLKAQEDENRKLKKLLAESMLDQAALKELLTKKW